MNEDPTRSFGGQHFFAGVGLLELDKVLLARAHAVAAPAVTERAGEAHVFDRAAASTDAVFPSGRRRSRSAPAGSRCRLTIVLDHEQLRRWNAVVQISILAR